jgi:hypothetical protein
VNRIDEIEIKIGNIQNVLLDAYHNHTHGSGYVGNLIHELINLKITYGEFGNYVEQAIEMRQEILDKLRLLLKKTLDNDTPHSLEDIKQIIVVSKKRSFNDRPTSVFYEI